MIRSATVASLVRKATLPALLLVSAVLGGCASLPAPRTLACAQSERPEIRFSADGRTASATLDVLTYNIEGLPWPARSGRSAELRQIGETLRELRKSGDAPDVVLFQEVFSGAAAKGVTNADYPALVAGPTRKQRSVYTAEAELPGRAKPRKGEIGLRFMTSGLAIASRYPIAASKSDPFSRSTCAGFDCLANKGVLFARIAIPGVPVPVEVFNTHMNAQSASGVKPERHLASHNAQAVELTRFARSIWDRRNPIIFGGDFNMKQAPERYEVFRRLQPLVLVHEHCLPEGQCDVKVSWDGDAPWLDTQDLQLFASGIDVRIRPVRVEAMFDGSPASPALSDHDGFRVVYEISWDVEVPTSNMCGFDPTLTPRTSR